MQLLFHGSMLMAQALSPQLQALEEFVKSPGFRDLAVIIAVMFVLGQIVAVFADWIASKAVADKGDATLRNGFKLWLYHLVASFVWMAASVLLLSMVTGSDGLRLMIVGGGMFLLGLLVVFLIPMKIYRIGFWAALGMLLLSWVMQTAIMTAVQFAAVHLPFKGTHFTMLRELSDSNAESRQRFLEQMLGKVAPDEIDRMLNDAMNPTKGKKSLEEREAAVTGLQRKLEERRRSLPPGDAEANAKFQHQLERYKRLLKDVNEERAIVRSARR